MAGPNPGSHPIHIHPVRPLYRYSATLLGASMWFFVRLPFDWHRFGGDFRLTSFQLFYRMKKDGPALLGLKHPWDH